jgi:hypothetical protein
MKSRETHPLPKIRLASNGMTSVGAAEDEYVSFDVGCDDYDG